MHRDIADDPLRHFCLRRINRNAASVRMIDCNDVVHVGILGKDLRLDPADRDVQNARHALHCRINRQNIAGSGGTERAGSCNSLFISCIHRVPERIPVSHPGCPCGLRQFCHNILHELK